MRYTFLSVLAATLAAFSLAPYALAADTTASGFVYKPPMRGAPTSRVGGGSRSGGLANFTLNVLAPEQTGLTTEPQPTLYWYVSGPSIAKLEVTIIAEVAERPLLSQSIELKSGGVQSFDLAKHGITLKPDTEYEWFVSAVPDPAQRSKDVTSGGTIKLVSDSSVHARAAAAGERDAPKIYAEAGFWYNAIDALSRLIARNPGDAQLRSQRAALLEQVGLSAAAAYDKAGAR